MSQPPAIQLVAHRGNAREFPENTLPAFGSALELGLRHLELDVQLSADGVPIVIHDPELERTTGWRGSVFELSAAQLQALPASEPQRFGERFRATHLPSLTDVLAAMRGYADATLFVEIKCESLERFGHERVLSSVQRVLRQWSTHCVVISFDLEIITRSRACGLPIGWVLSNYDADERRQCDALQPQFLFCDHLRLPPAGALWSGSWHWAIYEVDSPPLARALAARGVTHIETMAAREMRAALPA